jgi:hypothetical protein
VHWALCVDVKAFVHCGSHTLLLLPSPSHPHLYLLLQHLYDYVGLGLICTLVPLITLTTERVQLKLSVF